MDVDFFKINFLFLLRITPEEGHTRSLLSIIINKCKLRFREIVVNKLLTTKNAKMIKISINNARRSDDDNDDQRGNEVY